jgi:hypothetical protein
MPRKSKRKELLEDLRKYAIIHMPEEDIEKILRMPVGAISRSKTLREEYSRARSEGQAGAHMIAMKAAKDGDPSGLKHFLEIVAGWKQEHSSAAAQSGPCPGCAAVISHLAPVLVARNLPASGRPEELARLAASLLMDMDLETKNHG